MSMYQMSIPPFIRMLGNLSHLLELAANYAETKKIDPAVLIDARLAPDMFPLVRQVQIATDTAKGCGARLAKVEVPSYPDTETSFPQLQERIKKTQDFLNSLHKTQIDGSEINPITLNVGGQVLNFTGEQYLSNFALPNFYFHISIAYAILRHNGLAIGKRDYLGG